LPVGNAAPQLVDSGFRAPLARRTFQQGNKRLDLGAEADDIGSNLRLGAAEKQGSNGNAASPPQSRRSETLKHVTAGNHDSYPLFLAES
jgi:hypothetical protein